MTGAYKILYLCSHGLFTTFPNSWNVKRYQNQLPMKYFRVSKPVKLEYARIGVVEAGRKE